MGNEVHNCEGLVVDLNAVGNEVHDGGGLVEDLHTVGDEQVVGLDDWCQRLDHSDGSCTGKLCLARLNSSSL